MDHISELRGSLNRYFGWNKARMECFIHLLLGLMVTRTVNLNKVACTFLTKASQSSSYRRLQRFFAHFIVDYDHLAGFIFRLFFMTGGPFHLTMDRTNWQWGKTDINILLLGVVFKGTAIPIYWMLLDKKGNSDTAERIELMNTFIRHFGKATIASLLADREFVGQAWFQWLLSENIPFYIRIKKNTVTTNAQGLEIDMDALFYGLKPQEQRILSGKRKVYKHQLYLAGLRLDDGELLIVATTQAPEQAIITYGKRWEIETLFGCFKGRGFHFEDTHITQPERIQKMIALLAIAFCWAHKAGEWYHEQVPITLKQYGRRAISLFRYGLDYIVRAILTVFSLPEQLRLAWKQLMPDHLLQELKVSL